MSCFDAVSENNPQNVRKLKNQVFTTGQCRIFGAAGASGVIYPWCTPIAPGETTLSLIVGGLFSISIKLSVDYNALLFEQ